VRNCEITVRNPLKPVGTGYSCHSPFLTGKAAQDLEDPNLA